MKLRRFSMSDYEEVVDMFYDFTKEIYPNRKIGLKYRFYESVMDWMKKNLDIILVTNKDTVVGFSLCYTDSEGLTEPVYIGDIIYIKPQYRKGRASYMLFHNIAENAKDLNLTLVSSNRLSNGTADMVIKHFGAVPVFTQIEIRKES